MKRLYLYLADEFLGETVVGNVRGRETWMFRFADTGYYRLSRAEAEKRLAEMSAIVGPRYWRRESV